jgi:hypothetical protein
MKPYLYMVCEGKHPWSMYYSTLCLDESSLALARSHVPDKQTQLSFEYVVF